jgi:hypothetical protein
VVQLSMAESTGGPQTAKSAVGMVSVLPVQLRPGDTFTDDTVTWAVVGHSTSRRAGKSVVARVQRPDAFGWATSGSTTIRRGVRARVRQAEEQLF